MQSLRVTNLVKYFGATAALHEVSFCALANELVLLCGANGAGKSTLLSCLSGLTHPDSGEISFPQGKPSFGVLLQENFLYQELTVAENLRFYGALERVPQLDLAVETVLAQVGLERFSKKRVAELSLGMKKRLALGRATIHQPKLLLLDEPFAHLDADGCRAMLELLRWHRQQGGMQVVAAHDLDLSAIFPAHVLTLDRGRVVDDYYRLPDAPAVEVPRGEMIATAGVG